ncbi:hypothetical protein M758_10G005200 [Ceratodon purpureus]|nr:hypothetical protein M758_10G005200 [Ceratodon purpureus]
MVCVGDDGDRRCGSENLPKFMELIGLGYSAWFVYRYLLFQCSLVEGAYVSEDAMLVYYITESLKGIRQLQLNGR